VLVRLAGALGCGLFAVALGGQSPPHGPVFAVEWSRNSAWSLRETTGDFVNRAVTIPAGSGLGLRIGYPLTPWITARVDGYTVLRSGDNSDMSGYSAWRVGVEAHPRQRGRWLPYVSAVAGRLRESGGVHFAQGALGGGVQLHITGHFSLAAGGERTFVLDGVGGDRAVAPTTSVGAAQTRWSLGIVLATWR
jgi:hypothetical protein